MLASHSDAAIAAATPVASQSPPRPAYKGHAHFWDRAFSRRQFVMTAAGTTAAVVGAPLWLPGVAAAATGGDPKPIPGGLDLLGLVTGMPGPTFHVFFPVFKNEVST